MKALNRFRNEVKLWVNAYNAAKDERVDYHEILHNLERRIPEQSLALIGSGFINGWLVKESESGRGYFVKESDRQEARGGLPTLTHVGGGIVNPWWELYVQLADYCRLRTVAERHGLSTRLEDHLMDIAVYAGNKLVLYVENKTEQRDALRLIDKMAAYGQEGFNLGDPDKGNDPLRKCKYLIRDGFYPGYLGVSAINFEEMFRVEYLHDHNKFNLHQVNMSLTEPLINAVIEGEPRPRSVVDPLAIEIERLAGDRIWVSPGTGATAYNFYVQSDSGDAIFLGVYEDGKVWSSTKQLGEQRISRMTDGLASLGITLNQSKEWEFWKKQDVRFNLRDEDTSELAKVVVGALFGDKHGII
jgi:hypothetical protein